MDWPPWIEELKDRYLADEGNVFVVCGSVAVKAYTFEGEKLDPVALLVRYLKRTREVVAILRPAPPPSRLEFADFSDRQKFENLVRAQEFMTANARPLVETEPAQALGRIWRALCTTGTAQAYLVTDTERLLPGHRKRVDPIPDAPELLDWPLRPELKTSNNLLVFFAPDPDAVRAELIERSVIVMLSATRTSPAVGVVEVEEDGAEEHGVGEETPLEPGDLAGALARALPRAFVAHDEVGRAALLPVMQSVAEVVSRMRPEFAGLTFTANDEGKAVVAGGGAEEFLALWQADVVLSAAAEQLTAEVTARGASSIEGTALAALARRVGRWLR